jgi:monoamine oxidase
MAFPRSIRALFGALGGKTPARPPEGDCDVLVIGAGVAGLAAAQALRAEGLSTLTLEARERIGGRVWTDRARTTPVDIGASWVHGVDGNPIARLLREAGASLSRTDFNSITLYRDGSRIGERKSLDGFYRFVERRKEKIDDDESLQQTLDLYLRSERIEANREFMLRHLISTDIETEFGAEMSELSLEWFNEDEEFAGGDYFVASGYDALVAPLAEGLDIRLRSPVRTIVDTGEGVIVSTGSREFRAGAAIVAVPLGVLKRGAIRFTPPLSKAKRRALKALRMGNLHKSFLEFTHAFWDDSQTIAILRGDKFWREFINVTKEVGRPALVALHCGDTASSLARMSKEEIAARAYEALRVAYPNAAPPIDVTTTEWEDDPFSLGSYSFVPVGASLDMCRELARPQGRLCFAGEHTSHDYPATVHGAYLSGQRAARSVIRSSKLAQRSRAIG